METQLPTTTAELLSSLPEQKRTQLLEKLGPVEKAIALYDWKNHWARPKQLPPKGDWTIWVLLGGRGAGKTRTGAEWFRERAESRPRGRGMLIANTPADARDVMIAGESGILSVCPPWNYPAYEPSKRTLTWPNGYIATVRSAHNPEAVRGPEQDTLWTDELAAWPEKKGRKAWDNAMFGLRLGEDPQVLVSTTPKPIPLLKEILAHPGAVTIKSSTYENRSNLATAFFGTILAKYVGTTLGRQEIDAELLEEAEGALWKHALIEKGRVKEHPDFIRAVVGVDPSGGVVETGIVTAGLSKDGHVYVVADESLRGTPHTWGSIAVSQYVRHKLDHVVGEKNFGGTMVEHVVQTAAKSMGVAVRYKDALASRGKTIRAEPVVALYEQNRVHHVGVFSALEAEMTTWVPGEPSPNRIDALVWAVTELAVDELKPVEQVEVLWG